MSDKINKIDKIKFYYLKELNFLNQWLKSRNPKKMTLRVNDLIEEVKIFKTAPNYIKPTLQQHILKKADFIKKTIDNKIENVKAIDNFLKIIKTDFKDNNAILKNIEETKKMHDSYYNDLKKANDLIAKI